MIRTLALFLVLTLPAYAADPAQAPQVEAPAIVDYGPIIKPLADYTFGKIPKQPYLVCAPDTAVEVAWSCVVPALGLEAAAHFMRNGGYFKGLYVKIESDPTIHAILVAHLMAIWGDGIAATGKIQRMWMTPKILASVGYKGFTEIVIAPSEDPPATP